jgi:hypothetical protein
MTDKHLTVRGCSYENGPFTFCDYADVHAQPCMCSAPNARSLDEVLYRSEVYPDTWNAGCYWPIEDADGS